MSSVALRAGMLRTDWIGDLSGAVGNFFTDILKNIVSALLQGLTEVISAIGTWWMYIPAPVLEGEGGELSPGQRVAEATGWLIPTIGIISTAFVAVMIARQRNSEAVTNGIFAFIRVVLVSGAGMATTYLLLKFSDELSPWLLHQISGGTFEEGLGQLTGVDAAAVSGLTAGGITVLVLVLPFALIGGLLNMVFVLFSYGMVPVLAGLLPVAAAASITARGNHALQKMIGWIIALVLFKPTAAVIYGVGIASARMITGNSGSADGGQVIMQALYGVVVLCAAGIALPALIRIVQPAAAAGSSGGGGGNMLMGGLLVAGGAVTGGATAAAAATGASAGGGAGAAGAAGAAGSTGAAGAAGSAGSAGSAGAGSAGAAGGRASAAPAAAGSGGSSTSGGSHVAPSTAGAGNAPAGGAAASQPSTPAPAPAGASPRRSSIGASMRQSGAHHLRQQATDAERGIETGEEL